MAPDVGWRRGGGGGRGGDVSCPSKDGYVSWYVAKSRVTVSLKKPLKFNCQFIKILYLTVLQGCTYSFNISRQLGPIRILLAQPKYWPKAHYYYSDRELNNATTPTPRA